MKEKFFLLMIHDRFVHDRDHPNSSDRVVGTFDTQEEAEAEGKRILKERNDSDLSYSVIVLL